MNEELKIIIKAVTDEAKKNIKSVKDELDKVRDSGEKTGKSLGQSMKAIGKGVAVAVAAVAALTTAIAALGRKALEVNKGFEKLNTTFLNASSSTAQASNTYKELMGFLGDHDKAIETAQSLALITTEESKLAEWTNILQGAFAEMGDKLPIEGLAEAANETIKVGKVVGVMADALNWAGVSEDAFNASLAQTASLEEREALVRSTLNALYANSAALYAANNQATIQYNQSQANLNIALAEAAAYTVPLLTALNNLSTVLLGVFGPALRAIAIYLTAFIQLIAEAISWVGSFFGVFSNKSSKAAADTNGYKNAMSSYLNSLKNGFGASEKGIDGNINKLKELKKQTMGFDELNVVSKPIDTSSTGSVGGGGVGGLGNIPVAPDPSDFGIGSMDIDFSEFQADLSEAKEKLTGILTLVGAVAIAFGMWKLTDFVEKLVNSYDIVRGLKGVDLAANWNSLTQAEMESVQYLESIKASMLKIGGYISVAAGAMLLLQGYTDAWANGVDWGNLALMISGVVLVVGGLAMAFNGATAAFGAVIGGVAIFIASLKDFIQNGASVENVIGLIAGALLIIIPIVWAFNTALLANPIMLIVVAITALIAGIVALTAAFLMEEPAIKSVEEAQNALNEATERAVAAENDYISAVDGADSALERLQKAEKAAGMSGEELYKKVQEGTLDYADMNDKQRELYKAYLDNEQKQKDLKLATEELTAAKKAETIASFENDLALAKESGSYDNFKASVIDAFEKGQLSAEEARDLIEKSMSEMSNASQQTFMEDLPSDIKEGMNPHKYESTMTKMGKWFSGVWDDIVNAVGKYFTAEFWVEKFNSIKQGMKNALNGVIGMVEKAVNWIVRQLNKISIDIPDWVPLVGGKTFGFNLREVKLQRLAKGGIVNSATYAMIGEAGKEAVVPLENNTEWMDKLADRLAAQINTPAKIVLTLDGRELGWANINSINGITKQTGALQLKMV